MTTNDSMLETPMHNGNRLQNETTPDHLTPQDHLTVTVVIATRDRSADLELTVRSLLQQTVLPIQLVIVDQSVGNDGKEKIDRLFSGADAEQSRIRLLYVHDPSISGLTAARNRGMDVTEGQILLYLDDDVILGPDFVEQILAVYRSFPQAAGVSGVPTNYAIPGRMFRFWHQLFIRGPFRDERQPIYWHADQLQNCKPIPVTRFTGALMSFSMNAIRGYRFDENLLGGSPGEDVDFCVRLGDKTLLLVAPRARLVHTRAIIGRSQKHWVAQEAVVSHYLYFRNWRNRLHHRLCFFWLNAGYGLVSTLVSLRARSLAPWRDLLSAMERGREVGCADTHEKSGPVTRPRATKITS